MKKLLFLGVAAALCFSAAAYGVPATDIVEYPTGYFVPDDAQKYSTGYWRWANEDWGWTHNPIGGSVTTAELLISAWDVDAPAEVDVISAYDAASTSWITLGSLAGANAAWSYTTFTLGPDLYDDIAAGLQVAIDIDSTSGGWAVTLAKSVLSVDGGEVPDPDPSPKVPEPATTSLVAMGILGLVRLRKKLFA